MEIYLVRVTTHLLCFILEQGLSVFSLNRLELAVERRAVEVRISAVFLTLPPVRSSVCAMASRSISSIVIIGRDDAAEAGCVRAVKLLGQVFGHDLLFLRRRGRRAR